MKNVLKKSLSLLLAFTIIFSSAYVGLSEVDFSGLFEVKAQAASSGTCGTNVRWELDDSGTLTISGTGVMENYISHLSVPWCSSRVSIKSVIIESGVTSIGECAFKDCTSLTSITIPDGITNIGDYSFRDCTSLTSVKIPDSVLSIGNYAFYNSDNLTSITIPNNVMSIGECAFDGCTSLTTINVDSENAYYTSVDGVLFNKD